MTTRTSAQSSAIMSGVRHKNTRPELALRRLAHGMGYRYRLHGKGLPGKPDLVFSKRRAAVFVHGCFWHGHGCAQDRPPRSRLDFWLPKLSANRKRDERNQRLLEEAGWRVLTLWECELGDDVAVTARLRDFLGPTAYVSTGPPSSG